MQQLLRPSLARSRSSDAHQAGRRLQITGMTPPMLRGVVVPSRRRFLLPMVTMLVLVIGLIVPGYHCFTVQPSNSIHGSSHATIASRVLNMLQESVGSSSGGEGTPPPSSDEVIARRVTVVGDVGGYYRACVINEASRFRRLVGTMSAPDGVTKKAEIYVEGKKDKVEGFVRWCERSKVGLGQSIRVEGVVEEDPTGLYEGFYAYTE